MFDISVNDAGEVVLAGRFDAAQAAAAKEEFSKVQGDCTIHCRELDYISSAGIAVIIATYKRLHETGHRLKMVEVRESVRRVFHFAGLTKLFDVE